MIITSQAQREIKTEGLEETVKMGLSRSSGVESHIIKIS